MARDGARERIPSRRARRTGAGDAARDSGAAGSARAETPTRAMVLERIDTETRVGW